MRTCSVFVVSFSLACGFLHAQQPQQNPPVPSGAVIHVDTKLVLVDTVVTDKKGAYIRGLTMKDFKVWEDNKEQPIKTFSFEADPSSPLNAQPRYIVLFFDNSTMNLADQANARKAASSFIQSNAAPNRLMAIVNYGGSIQIAQNFTADAERLQQIVSGVKVPFTPTDGGGLGRAAADFGVRNSILALRSLAKNLATVPGRKTLILLTAGFKVSAEMLPDVTATIDMCNRSNVAVYPIDVRGLVASPATPIAGPRAELIGPGAPAFVYGFAPFYEPQQTGTGGGGGGGTGRAGGGPTASPGGTGTSPGAGSRGSVGSTSGTGTIGGGRGNTGSAGTVGAGGRSGGGMTPVPATLSPGRINPYNQSRSLVPKFPESATDNQHVMYMLADGTGGFVILNTNDLISGFEKIGKELNEYYLLGYTPPETDAEKAGCHILRVKVERSGATARSRTGYCDSKSKDVLAETPTVAALESHATSAQAGTIAVSMQAPYFYTSPNVARVNVALEIAPGTFQFGKEKGKMRSTVNILGIAYKPDGSVGARFSDAVHLEFENKKEVEAFEETPYHYENQFDIATGQYNLKVVFSSGGQAFGKVEQPLKIEAYDAKQFTISSLAFSNKMRKTSELDANLDAALIEDRTPLIALGYQITPAGTVQFKKSEKVGFYVEVYEPLLLDPDAKNVAVALQVKVFDLKTSEQKFDTGLFRITVPEKGGNPAIPFGAILPFQILNPGSYRVELIAADAAGKNFKRTGDFEVMP